MLFVGSSPTSLTKSRLNLSRKSGPHEPLRLPPKIHGNLPYNILLRYWRYFMAKRIIENGKYNVITCSDCGCKFAFDKTDVETNGKVTCPQCNTENTPTTKS